MKEHIEKKARMWRERHEVRPGLAQTYRVLVEAWAGGSPGRVPERGYL